MMFLSQLFWIISISPLTSETRFLSIQHKKLKTDQLCNPNLWLIVIFFLSYARAAFPCLSSEHWDDSQQYEEGISSSNPIDVKEKMSLLYSALRTADANKHIWGSERDM